MIQRIYAEIPYPPLGLNDSYGSMKQHGWKKPKNARTTTWQNDVIVVLKAAGLASFPDGVQEDTFTAVVYHLVSPDRDVDSPIKFLLDAIAWALGPKWDKINRPIYQDAWQGYATGVKEWAAPGQPGSLKVWITVTPCDGKEGFNELALAARNDALETLGFDSEVYAVPKAVVKPRRRKTSGKDHLARAAS